MKPTPEQLMSAVQSMTSMIPFFPKDDIGQKIITASLAKFVNTQDELEWLTVVACESIRDWDKGGGLPELRGLFCTRFKPADGITQYCTTPGYTATDLEAQFFAKEREQNEQRYEEFKRLAGPDAEAFPLPKPKLIQ